MKDLTVRSTGSRVSMASQRYMNLHGIFRREGDLAGLQRKAGIHVYEGFIKAVDFRGPVRPEVKVISNTRPKTFREIALAMEVARG